MLETIISNTKLNTKVFQPLLMAAFRPIAEMNLLHSWTRRTTLSTRCGTGALVVVFKKVNAPLK